MQPETALLFWWLHILNKRRYDALLAQCGSLDNALARLSPEILRGIGMRDDAIRKTFVRIEEFDAEAELRLLTKAGVSLVSLEDDAFPRLLKETADPPVFLSYRGDLSVLDQPCIALVGTREMSPYGKRLAEWIVPPLLHAHCTTVSGLAYGIDAVIAHRTLEYEGKTVAVLGSGLGCIYPREHARLAEKIVQGGGLLLSEYPYGQTPEQHHFPARNRIVAGLCLGTVVIEAPVESGALITARLALEENREVFAFPGNLFDPNMEGNHRLIAESRAQLLRTADDVLRAIGVVAPVTAAQQAFIFATDAETELFGMLTTLPSTMDDLVARSGKAAGELAATLTLLELGGAARKVGAGWVRS